ncbi:hypothetical protein CgunFtcFv8_016165 [Champsocephalus gunnari]|uniref:Uncharacterized protein n=1 Tax=Champsocephalus gunnari TaxID=52237 RepID=A0AAN8CQL0_CHAGU|nr:hypothetical protein CgunFtcFv8_016165 [Champsocephalus gunnari]
MLSALRGAVVVVEEGWRKADGPAGGSRCGATELTGLGPSGRMCANHNLSRSAAAPSAVWLWCMDKEEGERETLSYGKLEKQKVVKGKRGVGQRETDSRCVTYKGFSSSRLSCTALGLWDEDINRSDWKVQIHTVTLNASRRN